MCRRPRRGGPAETSDSCSFSLQSAVRSVKRQIRAHVALKDVGCSSALIFSPTKTASQQIKVPERKKSWKALPHWQGEDLRILGSFFHPAEAGRWHARRVWTRSSWTCFTDLGSCPNMKPTGRAGSTSPHAGLYLVSAQKL